MPPIRMPVKLILCAFALIASITVAYAVWIITPVSNRSATSISGSPAPTKTLQMVMPGSATSQLPDDNITKWINYKSESLGFEVMHPTSWEIFSSESKIIFGDQRIQDDGIVVTRFDRKGLDLIDWIHNNEIYINVPTQTNLTVGSQPAVELCAYSTEHFLSCAVYVVSHQDYVLEFTFYTRNAPQEAGMRLYRDILATFKLI